MSGSEQVTGGFKGDSAEAFAPAASGGCCGVRAANTQVPVQSEAAPSPCCGTSEQASAENSCCGATAKAEAVAAGTGCCG